MLDMTESIAPKSDQLNADDLMTGPRTFTVADVKRGSAEQPIEVYLTESDRPWRPSKTDRRVLVGAWGPDASAYAGKRITLYRDPTVRFGGQEVGGIRVSHMSGLDKPLKLALTVTRGKRAPYIVQPLADAAESINRTQTRELIAALDIVGLSDKTAALEYLSEQTGRPIAATKELTSEEAVRVLRALYQHQDPAPGERVAVETGELQPAEDPPAAWSADEVTVARPADAP